MARSARRLGEFVILTRDCELGQEGDEAEVVDLSPCPSGGQYMTLYFEGRKFPEVLTGADYKWLQPVDWQCPCDNPTCTEGTCRHVPPPL